MKTLANLVAPGDGSVEIRINGTVLAGIRVHTGDVIKAVLLAFPSERRGRGHSEGDSGCTCYFECGQDSCSGFWHQHANEPCSVHTDTEKVG